MSRPDRSPIHAHYSSPARTGLYSQHTGGDQLHINAFDHADVDVAFDPLSTNSRFPPIANLAVLGTFVFGGPTPESIDVMIPDCLLPLLGEDVCIDLRHLVTLSLGPAVDMGDSMPPPNLDRTLYPNSLAPTLGLQRREYWDEVNPLLSQRNNVNDARYPECNRLIRVIMASHFRLVHSEYVCFWRCPVPSLSGSRRSSTPRITLRIYTDSVRVAECLSTNASGHLALSGSTAGTTTSSQRARSSPHLRWFFTAAVDQLQIVYNSMLVPSAQPPSRSLMRRCVLPSKIVTTSHLREASCCCLHHATYRPPPCWWERPRPCRPWRTSLRP